MQIQEVRPHQPQAPVRPEPVSTPPSEPVDGLGPALPPPLPRPPLLGAAAEKPSSGPLTTLASRWEAMEQDYQAAREIMERVAAQRRLTDQRIAAMLANLSTQIFDMWQEVMARRQKACQDALDRWNKVMFG